MNVKVIFPYEDIEPAMQMAWHFHRFHTKMGEPIMSHVLDVMSRALHFGSDKNTFITACLHDVIERAGWEAFEAIYSCFGIEILQLVVDCSDKISMSELFFARYGSQNKDVICHDVEMYGIDIFSYLDIFPKNRIPWKDKKAYVIAAIPSLDKRAVLVLACEVICNIDRLIKRIHHSKDKLMIQDYLNIKGGPDGKLWYYDSILASLQGIKFSYSVIYDLKVVLDILRELLQ